jgi:hypothetical protein
MAEAGPEHEHPAEPEEAAGIDGAEDEAKRKFREALELKRARESDAAAGRGGKDGGKVAGAHGPAHTQRSFRRRGGG